VRAIELKPSAIQGGLLEDHHFGLHFAASERLARRGRPGQESMYLRTAMISVYALPETGASRNAADLGKGQRI